MNCDCIQLIKKKQHTHVFGSEDKGVPTNLPFQFTKLAAALRLPTSPPQSCRPG